MQRGIEGTKGKIGRGTEGSDSDAMQCNLFLPATNVVQAAILQ